MAIRALPSDLGPASHVLLSVLVWLRSLPGDSLPHGNRRDAPRFRSGEEGIDALEMVFGQARDERISQDVDDLGLSSFIYGVGWGGCVRRDQEVWVEALRVRCVGGSDPG